MRCPSPPLPPVTNATAPRRSMRCLLPAVPVFPGVCCRCRGSGKAGQTVDRDRTAADCPMPMAKGENEMATGPLSGIRILEFSGIGPGPFCGMLLSDMGADLLRIDREDGARGEKPHVTRRGRKSVALDLKR